MDYWNGYTNLHYRAAIAVKTPSLKKEQFGVAEVDSLTVVNYTARVVALIPLKRDLRFPNTTDAEGATLRRVVDELVPTGKATTMSLDRVLAFLTPDQQPGQRAVEVSVQPPRIFYSRQPSILVMFMGSPEFKPVETNRTDLMFALNTNWDVFYDTTESRYYLLNGASWITATDPVNGPWTPAQEKIPASLSTLPANENWADVRQNVPGKSAKSAPVVFVTTEPAELILTKGAPSYSPIPGTRLMRVANTESPLFFHSGQSQYYFLSAGRWFRTRTLEGPWSAASADLPVDFLNIPENNPAAFVKTSVPGTREAKDAVLLAAVPSTTTVAITNVVEQVVYSGAPQYVPIQGTTVQYAVNTPNQVFQVNGGYYWCNQGAWLCGPSANGPWAFCTSVPQAIYTIPPSNPNYNVTYVVVQSATPTTVVYSQTSGYSGEYVAATGVLMFGMGMLVGAAIANNHDHYHYPTPCYYSYGCGAVYHHGHGGYAAVAHVSYGPYGVAGRTAAYNPHTGTYSRGAYAYGPAGSASVRQAYNPYTGGYAQGGRVNTAYGSAGRFYAESGNGRSVSGGYNSGPNGSVAAIGGSGGAGAVAWDGRYSQGAVAKGKNGNVYAGKDGNVYKKDSSGNWSSNTGNGWDSVNKPAIPRTSATASSSAYQSSAARAQPTATTQTRQPSSSAWSGASRETTQSLDSQAQSRSWGDRQASSASKSRGSASSSSRSSRSRR